MADLSPAAQAVLNAALPAYDEEHLYVATAEQHASMIAAAALRAAADQAIPLEKTPWNTTLIPVLTSWESRDRLLAIAAELEGASG